jgi:hypothetical protein
VPVPPRPSPNRDGRRAKFAVAFANVHTSDDRLLHFRDAIPGNYSEMPQPVFGERNHVVESSLDYARGKKHNVVVKKVGAIALAVTHVLETAGDWNKSFASDAGTK